jgi:enoyl-CoA hydratase/carnithine racemase
VIGIKGLGGAFFMAKLQSKVSTKVTFKKVGEISVGCLSFSVPDTRNALSEALVNVLEDKVKEISKAIQEKGLSVLILHGGNAAFSSGSNLKERQDMSYASAIDFVDRLNDLFERIEKMPVVTIAAIEGVALGGGLELALSCDFRVAAESAELGLRETALGIIPGAGGTYRLLRVIPEAAAKASVFGAKKHTAQDAKAIGLVTEVFKDKNFLSQVYKHIEDNYSGISPYAIRQAKRTFEAFRGQYEKNFRQIERSFYLNTLYSADRIEGLAAFNEKRDPKFTGVESWMPEN